MRMFCLYVRPCLSVHNVKGVLLHCKRCPFAFLFVPFCIMKGILLQCVFVRYGRKAQKTWVKAIIAFTHAGCKRMSIVNLFYQCYRAFDKLT